MLVPDERRLLGEFLRAHRERLRPAGTGLRRRTPGLRREELAAAAGISVTWCAWIEQGRPVQASPDALSRIARALELNSAERAYLFQLAGRTDPEGPAPEAGDAPDSLSFLVHAVSEPAYGLDRLWNACCWNLAAERLFRGWLEVPGDRNLLRFVFLSAAAREILPDWRGRARRLLAEFRADYGRSFRDPRLRLFVDELRGESPEFRDAWDEQDVLAREGGLREFRSASGELQRFTQYTYSPADCPGHKLVVLRPSAPEEV